MSDVFVSGEAADQPVGDERVERGAQGRVF